MRRLCPLLLVVLLAVGLLPCWSASDAPSTERVPLGDADLAEYRHPLQIAAGLQYLRIARGHKAATDAYTVEAAFVGHKYLAAEAARLLTAQKMGPRIEMVGQKPDDDKTAGPLGYRVRCGRFESEEKAAEVCRKLAGKGFGNLSENAAEGTRGVLYTGEDGTADSGPWVIHVLDLDPQLFHGHVRSALASGVVSGTAPLSALSERLGAVASVNGGYFVMDKQDGTPGDPAGLSIVDGELVSAALNGRTCLLLPADLRQSPARIAAVNTYLSVRSQDGSGRVVDGLNRSPGLARSLGVGGVPKHDSTLALPSDLVRFTPVFGPQTPAGDGCEAVLNQAGQVGELRDHRGGPIPRDGTVLAGLGEAADWLRHHANPGAQLRFDTHIVARGTPRHSEDIFSAVNGGPRLLLNGHIWIPADAEGFNWPENPEFYYRFGVRRNPRTLAGVTRNGHLLLVTVDGRRPAHSVGASLMEAARLMQSLGAVDAVNLDGGGSTTMTVHSKLTNWPCGGEQRPIADAVVVTSDRP